MHFFPRQSSFYSCSWPLARWLKAHVSDYDVVHLHALFNWPTTLGAFHCQRSDVPYVVSPHGTLHRWAMDNRRPHLKRVSLSLIERRVLAGASAVQYSSETERAEAAWLARQIPVAVLPFGIALPPATSSPPVDFRQRHGLDPDQPIVLFLGRVDPVKAVDVLIAAFAAIHRQQPRAILVIAGTGNREYVARLRAEASRLGVAEGIVWTGATYGADKTALLATADVFVLTSRSDSLGLAALEAMAYGLPVVLSRQTGAAADAFAAGAALVVEPEDTQVAAAITALLLDSRRAAEMGERGRAMVRERFAVDVIARRLADFYRELRSDKSPSGA